MTLKYKWEKCVACLCRKFADMKAVSEWSRSSVGVKQPVWGQTVSVWKEGGVSLCNVNTSKQNISLLVTFLINWWTETTETGVVSCSTTWFVLGPVVIGMFIKCPVYNKMRSPYVKSADDPRGLWKAVNHPTDQEDDNKSCCSHHHATTAFSLPEMISQLLCFISFLSELSADECWNNLLVCRDLNKVCFLFICTIN